MIKSNDVSNKINDMSAILEKIKHQEESKTQTKCIVKKVEIVGPTICLSNCRYDIVHQVAQKYNLTEVEENENWDIFWSDYFVSFKRFRELKRFQRINHFPGMMEICRKDRLAKNLNNMLKLFPEDYAFFPRTWCFPTDLVQVLSYNRREKNKTYILKPVAGNKGRGILITKSLKDIRLDDKLICQEYLTRPYLIDGYKFDLRVYTLITSCDPLRIYIYNEGLVRFATCKYYEPTDFNTTNVFMHLTNYSVNKYSRKYKNDDESGSKRKLTWLYQYMAALGHDAERLWHNIDDVIIKTVFSILPTLRNSYYICFPHHDVVPACFELLGMDIILDSNLSPKLLEVNHSPSFHTDTTLDLEVKNNLLTDMFAMLNLEHSDKTKVHHLPDTTCTETKTSKKPTKVSYFIEYCCHEIQNKGSFRLIYPSKYQYLYNKFLEYAKSKFNPDIPCTKYVTIEEQEDQLKDITQEKNIVNPSTQIVHSDEKQSTHTLTTVTPTEVQDIAFSLKLIPSQPQTISDADEEERVMRLAQREVLVKSFGIVDLIYLSQKRNGVLRQDDEKKYKKMKFGNKMKRIKLRTSFDKQRNSPQVAIQPQPTVSRNTVHCLDLRKHNSKTISPTQPIQSLVFPKCNKTPSLELKFINPKVSTQVQNIFEFNKVDIVPPNPKPIEAPPICNIVPSKDQPEVKKDNKQTKFLTREDFHRIFAKHQTKQMLSVQSIKCDQALSKTQPFGTKNPYDDYIFSNKYNQPLVHKIMSEEVQCEKYEESKKQQSNIQKVLNSSILSQSRKPTQEINMTNTDTMKSQEKGQNIGVNVDISKLKITQNATRPSSATQKNIRKLRSNMPSNADFNQAKPANKIQSSTFDLKKKINKRVSNAENFTDVNNNDSYVVSEPKQNENLNDSSNKEDLLHDSRPQTGIKCPPPSPNFQAVRTPIKQNNQVFNKKNSQQTVPSKYDTSSKMIERPNLQDGTNLNTQNKQPSSTPNNSTIDKKQTVSQNPFKIGTTSNMIQHANFDLNKEDNNTNTNIKKTSTTNDKNQELLLPNPLKGGTTANVAQHTNQDSNKDGIKVKLNNQNAPDVKKTTSKLQNLPKGPIVLPKCKVSRIKIRPSIILKNKNSTSQENSQSLQNRTVSNNDDVKKSLNYKLQQLLKKSSNKVLTTPQNLPGVQKPDSKLNKKSKDILNPPTDKVLITPQNLPGVQKTDSKLNRKSKDILNPASDKVLTTPQNLPGVQKTDWKFNSKSKNVLNQTNDTRQPSITVFKKLSTRVPLNMSNFDKITVNTSKFTNGLVQSYKRPMSQPQETVLPLNLDAGPSRRSTSHSNVVSISESKNDRRPLSALKPDVQIQETPKNRNSKITLKKRGTRSRIHIKNIPNTSKTDSKPIQTQQSPPNSSMSRAITLVKKHSTRNILNVKTFPYLNKSDSKSDNQLQDQEESRISTVATTQNKPSGYILKKPRSRSRPVITIPYLDKNKIENQLQKPEVRKIAMKSPLTSILRSGKPFPNLMYTNSIFKKTKKVRVQEEPKHWSVDVKSHDKSCMCMGVSRLYMRSNIW